MALEAYLLQNDNTGAALHPLGTVEMLRNVWQARDCSLLNRYVQVQCVPRAGLQTFWPASGVRPDRMCYDLLQRRVFVGLSAATLVNVPGGVRSTVGRFSPPLPPYCYGLDILVSQQMPSDTGRKAGPSLYSCAVMLRFSRRLPLFRGRGQAPKKSSFGLSHPPRCLPVSNSIRKAALIFLLGSTQNLSDLEKGCPK